MAPNRTTLGSRQETLSALRSAPAVPPRLGLAEFDGPSRLSNPGNKMQREDFLRIAGDMARRDPAISLPRTPKTSARAALDASLANAAAPAFEGPGKAHMPDGLCVDPIALTVRIVYALIQQGR